MHLKQFPSFFSPIDSISLDNREHHINSPITTDSKESFPIPFQLPHTLLDLLFPMTILSTYSPSAHNLLKVYDTTLSTSPFILSLTHNNSAVIPEIDIDYYDVHHIPIEQVSQSYRSIPHFRFTPPHTFSTIESKHQNVSIKDLHGYMDYILNDLVNKNGKGIHAAISSLPQTIKFRFVSLNLSSFFGEFKSLLVYIIIITRCLEITLINFFLFRIQL